MKEGDNVEIFNAIKEIYQLFSDGKKNCEMFNWCCDSPNSTPNELCKTEPWKNAMRNLYVLMLFYGNIGI